MLLAALRDLFQLILSGSASRVRMVEIGDGIGEADEAYDAREIAVDGHVHAGIQDKPRRWGVRHSAEDDHRCGSVCICPAEARGFSCPAPLSLDGMRVGKRANNSVVPPIPDRPQVDAFVQINMVLAEILAQQVGQMVARCPGVRCGGQRGGVQIEKVGRGPFWGNTLSLKPAAVSLRPVTVLSRSKGLLARRSSGLKGEFQQSVHVLMAVGGFESVFDFRTPCLASAVVARWGGWPRLGFLR